MSEQKETEKQSSLKDLLSSLRETNSILDTTESRLNYLATNSPADVAKSDSTPSSESATLESLHIIATLLGRKAGNISRHTNTIVGN